MSEQLFQGELWSQPQARSQEHPVHQPGLWDEHFAKSGTTAELYTKGHLAGLPQLPGYKSRPWKQPNFNSLPPRKGNVIPLGPIGSTGREPSRSRKIPAAA